jgi:hypothetical protein
MFSRLAMLATAGAATMAAIGGAAHAQPALTQTCAFKAGPLDGQTIDFTGVPGVVAVPVGDRCADMQGSSGVAVLQGAGTQEAAPEATPPPEGARQPGQGRYYSSPGYSGPGYTGPGYSNPSPGYSGPGYSDQNYAGPGYYNRPGYYRSPGYYSSPGAPLARGAAWGQRCRFNRGPAAGSTLDYSHTLGAAPLAIGAPCADGASSGFIVGRGM